MLPLLGLLWFAFTSRDCLISAATFSRMGHGIGPGTLILHFYAAIFCSLMGWRAAGLPCQVELYLSLTALCSWAGHQPSLSLQVPPRSRAALRINTENPGCCLGLPGGLLEALFLPCVLIPFHYLLSWSGIESKHCGLFGALEWAWAMSKGCGGLTSWVKKAVVLGRSFVV